MLHSRVFPYTSKELQQPKKIVPIHIAISEYLLIIIFYHYLFLIITKQYYIASIYLRVELI